MEPIARDFYETEELLKVLAQRRKILEQRTALRMATMDEFKTVKTASIDRLKTTMSKQNLAATERNKKLLQEIGYVSATCLNKSGVGTASRSQNKDKLAEAKKKYLNYAEGLLPTWKQTKLDHYEEEMKRLKLKKHIAEERRKRLAIDVEKEEKMKMAIEKERRALSLALALEQQTQMQTRAAELLRMKEAEAADEALMQHFAAVSEELLDMVAAKSQQGAREVHAELAPYFRPPILPRYQNASDINAVNIVPLSQNAMVVQIDSGAADKPVTVNNNNNIIAPSGAGSHVGGEGGSLSSANITNPLFTTSTPSPNTITQPSSQLQSHSQSQKLQLTQQQQQQQQQDHNPNPNSPYRSDSAEEQYVAEQYLLMAGVPRSAVPLSRSPTPNSIQAVSGSSSSTHSLTGVPQTGMQPTTALLQPKPQSLLFNPVKMSDIHGQAQGQSQGQGQGFDVIRPTTTLLPTPTVASSSTEVAATDTPLLVTTTDAASVVSSPGLAGPLSSSAVARAASMSSSIGRTPEPTAAETTIITKDPGAGAIVATTATATESDRRGDRSEVSTDATTSGGGIGNALAGSLSNVFSHVDTSDTATEDDNSEDNSIHNSNHNVSSISRGHNMIKEGVAEGQGHNGDALIPMSASFTRSPRNSNNSSFNNLTISLKSQGLGQGQPGGAGGNAGYISAGLTLGESSKHASGTSHPESHVHGSSPSNHPNLSKTVREYHLELIDTLSHVECVKCIQALGTLIINHPSLTSSTLPPHAFFGAATAMLDTLPIIDIASTSNAFSSKNATGNSGSGSGSGRGLSREALLRNDQMVLTSQLKGDITVAGSMVLAIIEDFGGDLVPIECLYGVVSLERLRKEQKHTPGSQELWSAIISHLRTFLERFGTTHHATTTTAAITTTTDDGVDSLMVDEICRIVTDSLINTAEESDKSRIERKVSKLVRAALVPEAQAASPGGSMTSFNKGNNSPLGGGGTVGSSPRYNHPQSSNNPPSGVKSSTDSYSNSNPSSSVTSHLLSSPGMVTASSDGGASNVSRHNSFNNRMMTTSTPMTTSNTSFARTPHHAFELEDDELEDDEDLGAPPPLPDLAEQHRSTTRSSFLSTVFDRSNDAAEFDF